jgi:hydrogenase/urease accessory protein HupE
MQRPRLNSKSTLAWLALACLSLTAPVHAHAPGIVRDFPALPAYLRLGVEHIVSGFDHLAFVFGLVLVTSTRRSLLFAITAFTLAHSLSLALAMFDVVAPPSSWVEVAIALSIAYVGLENFFLHDGSLRFRLTFAFGLIHGFGFAGALREIGVPPDRAPAALALFNLGVEFGQLAVLALLLPLLGWLRTRPGRWAVHSRVLNAALVVLGIGWAVQRAALVRPVLPVAAAAASESSSTPTLTNVARAQALRSVAPSDRLHSATAERMCELLARLPRARRAQCGQTTLGVTLEHECSRLLAAALRDGALSIDADAAQRCEREQRARYADCSFMSAPALAPIVACTDMLQGQRAVDGACRSSLECESGLTCNGSGPFDVGVCAAPKRDGSSCGRAADMLATYLPHQEAQHAECAGSCVSGRCRATAPQL